MEILGEQNQYPNGEPVRYELHTVRELIQRLSKCNPDAVVLVWAKELGRRLCNEYLLGYDNVAYPVQCKLNDAIIALHTKSEGCIPTEYCEDFVLSDLIEQGVKIDEVVILNG